MSVEQDDYLWEFDRELKARGLRLPPEIQPRMGLFFYHLQQKNQQFNLTGYKSLTEFCDYHLADTLALMRIVDIPDGMALADVGSGCGVPGLLMKILRPNLNVTLVEANRKKAWFLKEMAEILELKADTVIYARAEEVVRSGNWRESMDFAVARALGPLPVALELTAGFVRVGGWIVLPRGGKENVEEESQRMAGELNCRLERVVPYELPGLNNPFQVVVYKKVAPLLVKYPRKPGRIRKRPL
ncbi:MAG: 16S rRNA (guanine(527)-N(7))-methyltransferase RsmG [bacterium]